MRVHVSNSYIWIIFRDLTNGTYMNTAVKRSRMRKVLEKRAKNKGKLYTKESGLQKKNTNMRKRMEL